MKRKIVGGLIAIVVVVLLAALWCHQQPSKLPTSSATVGAKYAEGGSSPKPKAIEAPVNQAPFRTFSIAQDGTAPVPTRFQLPGVYKVRTASSSKEWVAQFPLEQQTKITAFGMRHYGVFSVNSPQQVAWMAEQGYPMPEDVIAAEKLSDQDLRNLASQGNDKAAFLLHERNVDMLKAKYADLAAQGQDRSQFWLNDPLAAQMHQDDLAFQQLLRSSTSPFKGYVQAQDSVLEEDPQAAQIKVISGLSWAEGYGDFRADQFAINYVGRDSLRLTIYSAVTSMSINNSADIFLLRGVGCPGINVGNPIPGLVAPVE